MRCAFFLKAPVRTPFLSALEEAGYVAGHNVAIEYRFSDGRDERLPMLASDLVHRSATLLVATDRPSALAAKAATTTIPIVFGVGEDPVEVGLVASLSRLGGNATGVSVFTTELGPKRLGLVRELMPKPGLIAFVINPNTASKPCAPSAHRSSFPLTNAASCSWCNRLHSSLSA